LIFLIGGVFGAILGLALCLFVGALIRFRMDLNIFLYRILVIELISFLIGGFIGRSTARI
jgi:hypothetical protein